MHAVVSIAVVGASLAVASAVSGDVIGTLVEIGPEQHPEPGVVTTRVVVAFDDVTDAFTGVTHAPWDLNFETDGAELRQNCAVAPPGAPACLCDIFDVLDLGGDSWVSLGTRFGDTRMVGSWDGCDGCCIVGDRVRCFDTCGYIDPTPGSRVHPDDDGHVVVAQFSLPAGTCYTYEASAQYLTFEHESRSGRILAQVCVCAGDLDVSGRVDFADLLSLLAAWGPVNDCPAHVPPDLDKDCAVDFADLLTLLAAWGECKKP